MMVNNCQSCTFCKICCTDFSVSHRGKTDVSQHDKSAKHKHTHEAQKPAPPMTALITRNVSEANQMTKAQRKMVRLCAKNNVAFSFEMILTIADMFLNYPSLSKSTGKAKLLDGKM